MPRSTFLGKQAAWEIFQTLPQSDEPIDITSDWPLVRLLANTNDHVQALVGDGISRVYVRFQQEPPTLTIQLLQVSGGDTTLELSCSRKGKVAVAYRI